MSTTTNPAAPRLVYVSKIQTTPAKLWEALTNPEFIKQYWFGCYNTSNWQEGDAIESFSPEGKLEWKGRILKSIPEKEVAFTFDHLTDEPPSMVRFQIEELASEGLVQLTIIHEDFQVVSPIRDRVSNGWPSIIANIKLLLETGTTEEQTSCTAEKH